MTITVYGDPAAQGSKRHVGGGRLIEQSAKVKPWRQAVTWAAVEVRNQRKQNGLPDVITGAVTVRMVFTRPKPKSAPKKRQTWPDRRPDLDKLCRSTFDALSDAGVWEDDGRVVACQMRKTYPGEGTDALEVPGAVIRIEAIA